MYDDGSIKGKPDPDMYLKAMNILHAQPEDTIIFEDSYTGIKAAENAGAKVFIVDSNNQSYEGYNHPVIKNFDEVDRSTFL